MFPVGGLFQNLAVRVWGILIVFAICAISASGILRGCSAHKPLQHLRQFLAALSEGIIVGTSPGDGDILAGYPRHIDLQPLLVVHDVICSRIVDKALRPEEDMYPTPAGAEFRIAVHDADDLRSVLGVAPLLGDAVVQINGTDTVENPHADAIIVFGADRLLKGHEAAGVVAFGSLSRGGLVGYFGLSSPSVLVTPAEDELGQAYSEQEEALYEMLETKLEMLLMTLNKTGQKTALQRMIELAQIPDYQNHYFTAEERSAILQECKE